MALPDLSAADLLDALPEPALVIDADGVILAGNAAVRELLATGQVPAGEAITQFLPELERSRLNPLVWLRRWADHPDAPELTHVRLWCRDRNGTDKPVRVRVGRLPSKPVGYLVLLTDVSEEQAQAQRTRSAHRLAARVMAISADAIINIDESMAIVFANPSADALFGYPAGQLLGRSLADLLPPSFRASHEAFVRRFASEPAPARLMGERAEIRGLTRAGEEVPLEASITKVTTEHGLVFSANLRDLRPRNAMLAELARSEARFRTAFDHAQQAMALIDPDGRVQAMNAAARRLLPERVEPVGAPFATLPFWASDSEGMSRELPRALAQVLSGEPYHTLARVRLPGGGERTLDFSLSPVASEEGAFAVIAEARDVPDR
jgi:PAS domain S-box-containing protein